MFSRSSPSARPMTRHAAVFVPQGLSCLLISMANCAADAQPAPPKVSEPLVRATAATDTLIVTATRQPVRETDTPATVAVVDRADVQDGQLRINLSESLVRVPGLSILNRQNYAQDLQISSRGFGARASFGIRGLRLYVDDMPATFPDGQGQGAIVPLSAIQSLEVLRGPWAAAYGNSAGGVIQATTEPATRSARLAIESISSGDGLARLGLRVGARGNTAAAYLDLNDLATDGYRDHSATRRKQWFARLDVADPATQRPPLSLTAIVVDQPNTEDPLGLTEQQWRTNPRAAGTNAIAFNTRKSVRHQQLGSTFQSTASVFDWRVSAYAGTRNVEQFLATSVAAQGAASSSGGVVDLSRDFAGASLRAANESGAVKWTAGVEWDAAIEQRRGFENFVGSGTNLQLGVRGRERRNEQSRSSNAAVFTQMRGRAGERWGWMWSLRASQIAFSTLDRFVVAGNPDDSGRVTYRAITPAAGFTFDATQSMQLYASMARGVETPTSAELAYRPDGGAGLNFGLEPSVSRQTEIGLRWQPFTATSLRLVGFDVRATDEIVPANSSGGRASFQNAGATQRRGIEFSVEHAFAHHWRAALALTQLDARFTAPFRQNTVVGNVTTTRQIAADNRLPAVAPLSGYAELSWRKGQPGLSIALESVARRPMFADDANTSQAPGNAVTNLRLAYRSDWRSWRVQSFLRVDNLANRQVVGSVIVNEANARFFEPAPGRLISIGLAISMP